MKLVYLLAGLIFINAVNPLWAADAPRERLLMDSGWRFHLGDAPDAEAQFDYPEFARLDKNRPDDDAQEAKNAAARVDAVKDQVGAKVSFVQPGFDASAWRTLDLPHDWAVELPFDKRGDKDHGFKALGPNIGHTIGWYRRTFDLPATDQGRALWIEFDGVYRNCVVWLNGVCLGRGVSGYDGFHYDIGTQAIYGGKNTLVVRVDASRNEGWFYEGAGIYRHVWLVKTGPVHVSHWGTFVTTSLHGATAEVIVETTLRNDSPQPHTVRLLSTILDDAGQSVGEATQPGMNIAAHSETTITQKLTAPDAKLWSLEKPALYQLVSRVEGGPDARPLDRWETPFGIRTIRWDAKAGFLLNGKPVVIRGTANHQDAAGVGVAVPDQLGVWRLQQLKKFGVNAYRTAHGPATPELLDACDQLGLLVYTEHRRIGRDPESFRQLETLIRRDRNHPSIIVWGLGNEELSSQGKEQDAKNIAAPNQDIVHRLDPTRPATFAMNWDWGNGYSKVLDVQGFNYWWQGTHSKNRGKFLDVDEFHAAFPDKPAFGSEEASTVGTRGIYENDKAHGFLSAYDRNLPRGGDAQREWGSTAEAWLNYYAARSWLAGAFVWTGFDYRGEPTPYGWPNISSQFGLLDTCGFPKDNAYFYQAWWTQQPVLHVFPHWNWPGKEGQEIEVWVHSNHEAVELFLNGKSLGKKDLPRFSHLAWNVAYQPGTLEARGYRDGKVVETTQVETTGAPVALALVTDRPTLHADGDDVALFTVSARDARGRAVPTASDLVKFEVVGGKIIGVGNGDPTCHESDKGQERSLFNGLAQIIVQSRGLPGAVTVSAKAEGLKAASATVQAQAAAARPTLPVLAAQ